MGPRTAITIGWLALAVAWSGTPSSAAVPIRTSDQCGTCHRDIHRMWRKSAHAEAMEDPRFLHVFREVQAAGRTQLAAKCLECHAPLASLLGDRELTHKLTWEGVTCEFCHSVTGVSDDAAGPMYGLDPGPVKRGPIQGASSTGHEVEYSALFGDSLFCAPCHEYRTDDGTRIMTTYSEWKDSGAARRGESCQSCHMGFVRANVVDPRVKRDSGAMVNLHEMPGGHSIEQLYKALSVSITPERAADRLRVGIELTNRGAGHAVPTGMPGRRILLSVKVDTSEGKTHTAERSYGKVYRGSEGEPLKSVADLFAAGIRLDSDTRIAADEVRAESFEFPIAPDATAYLEVKLHYEHATAAGDRDRTWLTFFSERRLIRAR